MEQDKMKIELQPIRESTVLLVARIVFLMILFDAVYLVIRLLTLDLNKNWVPSRNITFMFLLFLSSLYIIQAVIVSFFIEAWTHRYYFIDEDKITEIKGVINRRERIYELKNVKSVRLYQGILGRIFNYGTLYITITSPNLREDLILVNVSQAKTITAYIKRYLQ
ncbi:PH domain-containing protein [Patescibacteria group bacterium]|nr:PH domain-containing protein [Patescibacteria group bacterium]MCL5010212.1 PH domain-containing protein [Patescibacteria group bacterium]